ncbi:DUF7344 domain-containing protein [Halorussus litoreus]|uniref:DUF7344 domain-containing protein n=1 Tax=Halorussus litoreus TaxID=1710536 RepID=UPI0018E572A8|nr:hypothetical protein [Halorussus litoreus]
MTTTESTFDANSEATSRGSERESRLDAVFDALASPACRVVLARLATADDALDVADLAEELDELGERRDELAARQDEEFDSTDPARATLARLHHTYLPKLDDVGLVAYDADREVVDSTPSAESGELRAAVEDVAAADLPVELDALFELLSNARRRHAFRTLLAHEEASLADLADDVAVAERNRRLSRIDPDDVLEVYLSLYHTHVPKLTGIGVARYDQELDLVALTDEGRRLESVVQELYEAVDA